jgi:hypothetical protein
MNPGANYGFAVAIVNHVETLKAESELGMKAGLGAAGALVVLFVRCSFSNRHLPFACLFSNRHLPFVTLLGFIMLLGRGAKHSRDPIACLAIATFLPLMHPNHATTTR